jgi:hypothetical protein
VTGVLITAVAFLCIGGLAFLRVRSTGRRVQVLVEASKGSLAECQAWKALVEGGLAEAAAEGRWVSRDRVRGWLDQRPEPSAALRRLAKHGTARNEARAALDFLDQDLPATVSAFNRQILADELVARRQFFDSIETQPLTD